MILLKCPHCQGSGHNCDATAIFGPRSEDCSYTPPTACALCLGKGLIQAIPIEDMSYAYLASERRKREGRGP